MPLLLEQRLLIKTYGALAVMGAEQLSVRSMRQMEYLNDVCLAVSARIEFGKRGGNELEFEIKYPDLALLIQRAEDLENPHLTSPVGAGEE